MANTESPICLEQVFDSDSADHDGAHEPADAQPWFAQANLIRYVLR